MGQSETHPGEALPYGVAEIAPPSNEGRGGMEDALKVRKRRSSVKKLGSSRGRGKRRLMDEGGQRKGV